MDTSKYKALYLQEAKEHLKGIEQGLLTLEEKPGDKPTVDNLFRHYHSIKGMSASMGYVPIQKLAHAQEDLLDKIRGGSTELTPEITSALLECSDALKALIKRVEDDEPLDSDISAFITRLKDAEEGKTTTPSGDAPGTGPAEEAAQPIETPVPTLALSSVMKVESAVFDDLLSTVGELFMELSSFKSIAHSSRSVKLRDGVYMLGKSIDKIYNSIISARMLPMEDLVAGLPRVVRDISKKSGKEVELRVQGSDIKLDRAILEDLASPLVHIIRNAVDHGIEPPARRASSGKTAKGTILINAYAKRDHVVLEISDDGRGIDTDKLKEKALKAGFSAEKLSAMSRASAMMLVCEPGLSSADTVSETSGRGVGMDVVKGAIEAIGGKMEIDSALGEGTKFTLVLPRATSIIKALTVRVAGDTFLLPISRIEMVVEVKKDELSGGRLTREGLDVPVLPLAAALGKLEGPLRGNYTVIIVKAAGEHATEGAQEDGGKNLVGIRVDDFSEEIDAFIKPLVPPVTKLWGVSGIAIMGDGTPAFLIDLTQITMKAF